MWECGGIFDPYHLTAIALSFGPRIRYPEVCTRMANTFSALKRMRQTKRKTLINRLRKSRLRHQIRSVRRLIEQKDAKGAQAALPVTFSVIDRSARWGIIKKNTAARYKSRIQARLKALAAA
jgi:small subunit ribosomal protein S20